MKLTFSTLGAPELSFTEILELTKENGFDAIELRGILSDVSTDALPMLLPQNRERTREQLLEYGINIHVLGCSASFHTGSEKALSEIKYAISAAKVLGTPYIRVFGDKCPDRETFLRVKEGLAEACRMAKGSGVTVLLEAHGDFNRASIIKSITDMLPSLGIIWDIEHTHLAGEEPKKIISELLPRIKHVHIKDVNSEGKLSLIGEGCIPVKEIVNELLRAGYEGYFSLEWEKRWHPELPPIKEALDSFKGVLKCE